MVESANSANPETVREALKKKHPPGQSGIKSAIFSPSTPATQPHPVLFDRIDGDLIRNTVADGAAGPSRLNAAALKRLCMSFKFAFTDLSEAVAATARCLCTSYVDPARISTLVACHLIALDKCPGVRPIGIGEAVRGVIGRAAATTIGEDIQAAAGPLQVCAGHLAGCEAAVHAMRQVFESPETEAVILVDTSNAFNTLNWKVALQNINSLCPSLAKIIINTYQDDVQLFIDGETLLSQEGTTQGDPLVMAMYAIAISPLIRRLEDEHAKHVWFADDATAGGDLAHLNLVGTNCRPGT